MLAKIETKIEAELETNNEKLEVLRNSLVSRMGIHQVRTEEEILAKMDAHQERMGASKNAWRKETTAYQEATQSKEPTFVKTVSAMMHEKVPKEEAAVKPIKSTGEAVWGPEPGRWYIPEEVGRRLQRGDPTCQSSTAYETLLSGTRQGQDSSRNPERTDVREETSGET
jgi:hypothetical protein